MFLKVLKNNVVITDNNDKFDFILGVNNIHLLKTIINEKKTPTYKVESLLIEIQEFSTSYRTPIKRSVTLADLIKLIKSAKSYNFIEGSFMHENATFFYNVVIYHKESKIFIYV